LIVRLMGGFGRGACRLRIELPMDRAEQTDNQDGGAP